MKPDQIYKDLHFSSEFSIEDWNNLLKIKFGKYFSDEAFEKNKESLRTEIINYLKFCTKPDYLKLFEWTSDIYKDCLNTDSQKIIKVLADSFDDTSNTDTKWMTNVLTQPDHKNFSERDKISYYFKIIDETLEGVFKPRFKLLDKLVNFKLNHSIPDNSKSDFGKLIKDFPLQLKSDAKLFLEDPIFSISTNQWRNIAAHKSFIINKNDIVVEYGRNNIQTLVMSYDNFYKILEWTQGIYRVIRLGQVLTYLRHIEEIVLELGGTENINIRYESSLLHIIHNMQTVGFEYVSKEEQGDTFTLNVKGKINHDVKSSLIHASQCLDQLSCAIYDDKFVRENFKKTKICIVDNDLNTLASATIYIQEALKKTNGELALDEYLNKMTFEIKNYV